MREAAGEQQARWRTEVLRRASAALNGRMVGEWELGAEDALVPVAYTTSETQAREATPDVREALRHLAMPVRAGSRWVAGRLGEGALWCVAPVRDRAPDPPPFGRERRSRERLALELAGLCLGLSERQSGPPAEEPDLLERFTEQLGTFAQEVATPIAAARSAVARAGAMLGGEARQDPAGRVKAFEDLRSASTALEEAAALVKTVQERARAVLARGEQFDLVGVVWSAVDAERAQAALRGATLELKTLAYVVPIPGRADQLREAVATAIKAAVQALAGRVGTVLVSLENVGPVVRLAIHTPGTAGLNPSEGPLATLRQTVERAFGGTFTVTGSAAEGTLLAITVPVSSHRFRDPGLWWER